ncbi:MAG: restriction endonuclease [Bacteroidales bacterium]|nr:restriction endonuclease [Bacteroidales bacterium]
MTNDFHITINKILSEHFGENSIDIYDKSLLLQYIDYKTKSANRGSKARNSFANLYALYVIIEDYIKGKFDTKGGYKKYEGAKFTSLLKRQRELPFGNKLQNHALNNRMNSEFQKCFPTCGLQPIIRDLHTNRYWINENLLKISVSRKNYNIASVIIDILNEYIKIKQDSFKRFIAQCEGLQNINISEITEIKDYILTLLAPNVDARIFEIVSYAILKYYYGDQMIIWGFSWEVLNEENLKLYKTGRTNANDGGIDFVMKPLGRFFQVTETIDFKKYFLDIEKIERFPISFVIKTEEKEEIILNQLRLGAEKDFIVTQIVEKYMGCIEEIITIPKLLTYLHEISTNGHIRDVLNEIILQSKVEFNIEDEELMD